MNFPTHSQPPPECPAHAAPTALYGDVLTGDTHSLYEELREKHGPVAPIELEPGVPAWLVLGYWELLEVTRNEEAFSHDSRRWRALQEGMVREDSPLMPMMGYRPVVMFTDGPTQRRYSRAVTAAINRIDQNELRQTVSELSDQLIATIAPRGNAELVLEYAYQLPLLVVNRLLGLPDDMAPHLIKAVRDVADSSSDAAQAGNRKLQEIFGSLIQDRMTQRGDDLPSWLMDHPAQLSPQEVAGHLAVMIIGGNGPAAHWIANTVLLMLLDSRFRANLTGGRRTVDTALDEVLWRDTPVQNFPGRYATRDLQFGGQFIKKGDALILGLAAANRDPAIQPVGQPVQPGNRSHVAFSAGPHTCPAITQARIIVHTAVDTLIHRLPDLQLAVSAKELTYRPSPWSRALTSLPVRFTPSQPASTGGSSWSHPPHQFA